MNVKKQASPSVFSVMERDMADYGAHTTRSEDELVESHPLQDRKCRAVLRDLKRSRQELEPVELHRRYQEAV